LNHGREERAGCHRAQPAGNEPLERTAQRVARKSFQTFGEMVDSEQEQTQSTKERYDNGDIHGLRLDSSFSNVGQNHFKKIHHGAKKNYLMISPNLAFFCAWHERQISVSAKIPNIFG
jgi:hypothetical protein